MAELPFNIPPSLASYLEQFDSAPQKTTGRLHKQLKKRGPDAVGYFLLAWFYHLQEKQQEAVEAALKAKTFAPGSPFFEKLHYFFSHPLLFDAWCHTQPSHSASDPEYYSPASSGPILDLDHLIQKLAKVESTRIKFDADTPPGASESFSEQTDDVDDIVSETLATIHEKQGKIRAAINTYKRLKKIRKEKKSFYEQEIQRLEKIQANKKEKDS